MHNQQFSSITTSHLILNKFSEADILVLIEYAGNYNVARNTLNIPHPYTEKDAIDWIKNCEETYANQTRYSFAIRLKTTLEFIGGIGLTPDKRFNHAELGYWIAEPFWNKGYATEAAKAIIEFGFKKLHLHKIFATHIAENSASGKVMQHIGMIKEGELIDHTFRDGKYFTLIQYGIVTENNA